MTKRAQRPAVAIDKRPMRSTGFTLIELTIVLLVVGLMIGGILVGRDLIHLAELRSVVSQVQGYNTAVAVFRLKYNCLPGDCPNATAFALGDAACPPGPGPEDSGCIGPPTFPQVGCNGNGNRWLEDYGICVENYKFWYHLHSAGLIADPMDGKSTQVDYTHGGTIIPVFGKSAPATKLRDVGILIVSYNLDNNGILSTWYAVGLNYLNIQPWFKLIPSEAYYMDMKLDDGSAGSGLVIYPPAYSPFIGDSTHCLNTRAEWDVSASDPRCYALVKETAFGRATLN